VRNGANLRAPRPAAVTPNQVARTILRTLPESSPRRPASLLIRTTPSPYSSLPLETILQATSKILQEKQPPADIAAPRRGVPLHGWREL
jgi:hypothetical protein